MVPELLTVPQQNEGGPCLNGLNISATGDARANMRSQRSEPLYDVFLSYNSKNRADAQALVRLLEARGLRVFWDRQYLKVGRPFDEGLEEALRSSRTFVILVGPQGLGNWQRKEVGVALDRQAADRDLLVIPVLLPRAHPLPLLLGMNTWVDLQKGVGDPLAVDILVTSIAGQISVADREKQQETIQALVCPYRGLLSFREDDAEFFCGRDAIVDQLESSLSKNRFVVLVGPSGGGKSSVVHAGLIPRLRRSAGNQFWDFVLMRPTDRPLRSLATSLFSLLEPGLSGIEKTKGIQFLVEHFAEGTLDLSDLLVQARDRKPGIGPLLLVVDQWEELYTGRNKRAGARFIEQVLAALEKGLLWVVCTLRIDFVAKLLDEAGLKDRLEGALVYLRRMHADEMRSAIEEPAHKVGLTFQDGLVDRILDDLGEEPGQLPLLEFVLTELWKKRQDGLLRHADYEELGGGRKALASRAEEIFAGLPADYQEAVRRLFLQLVRPGEGTQDTRRRVDLEDIGEAGREVIQPLVEARLLTTHLTGEESDETESIENFEESEGAVEMTHEALITHWDRLRKWLDENRDFLLWRERLRLARSAWESEGRDPGFLLTRAPLVEAEEWITRQRSDLNEAEADFIERSLKVWRGELKKIARRRRLVLLAWAGVALLSLAFAMLGFWWWRHSLSRALAAEAASLHEGPLDIALLLSLQAEKTAHTVEASDSLLTLFDAGQPLKAFLPGRGGPIFRAVFSPDGSMVATGGTGEILVWDAGTGRRQGSPFHGHEGHVLGLAFSGDGSSLASSGEDLTLRLWRVADRQPVGAVLRLPAPVRNLAFSPDGRFLVGSQGKAIRFWSIPGLQLAGEIPDAHPSWISGLAFGPDGHLASSGTDGTIALWDLGSRTKLRTFSVPKTQVMSVAFHPTQPILASAGSDHTVRLWDVASGTQLGDPPLVHSDTVLSIAFSRDGKTLASAGRDKAILLWDVTSGAWDRSNVRPFQTLHGHGKTVWTLALGQDGALVSGGDEDSAILWNLHAEPRFAQPAAGLQGKFDSVAFHADGDLMAAGAEDGTIRLWDPVSHQPRGSSFKAHQGAVSGLAFRQRTLLSTGADGRILLWDVDHPESRPRQLEEPGGAVPAGIWSLALSPDRKLVAVGDESGRVRLWSLDPERFLGEMSARHDGTVYGLAFSADGSLLASGGVDGLIRLWGVRQRKLTLSLKDHEDAITGLAFQPGGEILASASADRTVRLWNVRTGTQRTGSPLTGPEDALTGVSFSPDGKIVAASGLKGRVFLWEAGSGHPVGPGLQGTDSALNVTFHPNGKFLVSGTDQSVLLFDLRYETWRVEACRTVARNLTDEEWHKYLRREPYRRTCPENVKNQ